MPGTVDTPFVTDTLIRGVAGTIAGPAVVLLYLDARGATVARSVSTPDEIERHGRDLIAAARAARAADPRVVPIGRPGGRSTLMPGLRSGTDAA